LEYQVADHAELRSHASVCHFFSEVDIALLGSLVYAWLVMTLRYCSMPWATSWEVMPFWLSHPMASQQVSLTDRPAALTAAERVGMKEAALLPSESMPE
jgi:hypothetical protein